MNVRLFSSIFSSDGSFTLVPSFATWFFAKRKLRLEPILLFILVTAAFLVRVWGISRVHYWDEMVYLQNAQVICCGKTNYSELSFRPPLISMLFAGVFLVWHSTYAACIITALLNAVGPLFVYRAGSVVFGRIPAALAGLLLAFSPFFVGVFPDGFISDDTGNSLLTDSPALTPISLAFWLQLRALARPDVSRFLWAGVVLALSVLMRFGSLPSVAMLCLLPLAALRRWRALAACGAGFTAGMFPYLLWSKVEFGGLFHTLCEGWSNVEGPEWSSFYFIQNAPTIFTPIAIIGLAMAACWGIWRVYRGWPLRARFDFSDADALPVLVELFLWLWLLGDFAFFSAMPHKEPRYILPLVPPLLLLAGSGLSLFRDLPGRRLRLAGATLLAACLLFTFLPDRKRFAEPFLEPSVPEEMLASQFLNGALSANTTLYMNFNYPAFAYYTSFPIAELPAVGPALYHAIQQIPAGGVFIVYRETEGGQPEISWVDSNTRFQRLREYSTFVVYRCVATGSG